VLVYASLGALVALAVQPLRGALDRDRGARHAVEWRSALLPVRAVLGHPALRALVVAAFGLAVIQTALIVYGVSYLHFDRGTTLVAAGFAYSAAQLLSLPGRVLWGWLSDRSGDPVGVLNGVAAGTVVFCLALGLYPDAWPEWPAAVLLAVFGMVGASWNGVNLATVAKFAPPEQFAQAYAGILFVMFIGGAVGSFFFGVVVDVAGNYASVFVGSALIGTGVVAVLRAYRRRVSLHPAA
jgi:MFS family permease